MNCNDVEPWNDAVLFLRISLLDPTSLHDALGKKCQYI